MLGNFATQLEASQRSVLSLLQSIAHYSYIRNVVLVPDSWQHLPKSGTVTPHNQKLGNGT